MHTEWCATVGASVYLVEEKTGCDLKGKETWRGGSRLSQTNLSSHRSYASSEGNDC